MVFIGGRWTKKSFRWTDDSKVDFLNWYQADTVPMDPDGIENCTAMITGSGEWHDFNCFYDGHKYICKKSFESSKF